jgi:hypothetical protein
MTPLVLNFAWHPDEHGAAVGAMGPLGEKESHGPGIDHPHASVEPRVPRRADTSTPHSFGAEKRRLVGQCVARAAALRVAAGAFRLEEHEHRRVEVNDPGSIVGGHARTASRSKFRDLTATGGRAKRRARSISGYAHIPKELAKPGQVSPGHEPRRLARSYPPRGMRGASVSPSPVLNSKTEGRLTLVSVCDHIPTRGVGVYDSRGFDGTPLRAGLRGALLERPGFRWFQRLGQGYELASADL